MPTGEYLAFLSVKYAIDPDKFFKALASAKEHQKVTCGNISIECRGWVEKEVVFLMMKDSAIVAQCRVSEELLLERDNPLRKFMRTDRVLKELAKKTATSYSHSIQGLRSGMSHVNLRAEVLEIPKPIMVYTRFGNTAVVVNALIRDKTGTIKLCLWNDQIQSISVGDTIEIKNAKAFDFKGERQLRIGKRGTLSVSQNCATPPSITV